MDQPDHAERIRIQLWRIIARKIHQDVATGEWSRPLEHLLRVMNAEKPGLRGKNSDVGQLWLSHDRSEAYFARAMEICEATGAVVVHSGSQAVYYRPDDRITIPMRKRFPDHAAYFNTRFHETAHWAEKRVGWTGSYAEGELIAVLASFHLAQAANISDVDIGDSREYHEPWVWQIFLERSLRGSQDGRGPFPWGGSCHGIHAETVARRVHPADAGEDGGDARSGRRRDQRGAAGTGHLGQ